MALNPAVGELLPEAEVLIVDRMSEPPRAVITPTDQAYRLVGLIKSSWHGISGGPEVEQAVDGFFQELAARA